MNLSIFSGAFNWVLHMPQSLQKLPFGSISSCLKLFMVSSLYLYFPANSNKYEVAIAVSERKQKQQDASISHVIIYCDVNITQNYGKMI